MTFIKHVFGHWGITAKLTTLFILFGLVPMGAVGLIAHNASLTIEGSVGTRFQAMAEGVADKIDRNLFERYGDVQAFGFNQVLDQKAAWYRADDEDNPIREVINQYVDTYDLYSLSLLVDLDGRVIAVNSKDADGKPIQSQDLYKKNYGETAWFRALKAQQFTTTMPFSAPGNTVATGTYIEDLHVDPDVKASYPGDEGLTLGFSAPVYRDGKVVAYWTQSRQVLARGRYAARDPNGLEERRVSQLGRPPPRQGRKDSCGLRASCGGHRAVPARLDDADDRQSGRPWEPGGQRGRCRKDRLRDRPTPPDWDSADDRLHAPQGGVRVSRHELVDSRRGRLRRCNRRCPRDQPERTDRDPRVCGADPADWHSDRATSAPKALSWSAKRRRSLPAARSTRVSRSRPRTRLARWLGGSTRWGRHSRRR